MLSSGSPNDGLSIQTLALLFNLTAKRLVLPLRSVLAVTLQRWVVLLTDCGALAEAWSETDEGS